MYIRTFCKQQFEPFLNHPSKQLYVKESYPHYNMPLDLASYICFIFNKQLCHFLVAILTSSMQGSIAISILQVNIRSMLDKQFCHIFIIMQTSFM